MIAWHDHDRVDAFASSVDMSAMKLVWLHVSDFHFKGGDPYDRDVVLRALVRSVAEYRERGRQPDLIFATGDVAFSGKEASTGQRPRSSMR